MITLLGRLGVTHLLNPKETLRTLALCPQTPLGSDPVTERKPRMGRAAAKERSRKGNAVVNSKISQHVLDRIYLFDKKKKNIRSKPI